MRRKIEVVVMERERERERERETQRERERERQRDWSSDNIMYGVKLRWETHVKRVHREMRTYFLIFLRTIFKHDVIECQG